MNFGLINWLPAVFILAAEAAQAFRWSDNVGQANTDFIVHYYNLALRDKKTVNHYIERFTRLAVQFHYRSLCQLQQIFDGHLGTAKLNR